MRKKTDELSVLGRIVKELESLNGTSQRRVVSYINDLVFYRPEVSKPKLMKIHIDPEQVEPMKITINPDDMNQPPREWNEREGGDGPYPPIAEPIPKVGELFPDDGIPASPPDPEPDYPSPVEF